MFYLQWNKNHLCVKFWISRGISHFNTLFEGWVFPIMPPFVTWPYRNANSKSILHRIIQIGRRFYFRNYFRNLFSPVWRHMSHSWWVSSCRETKDESPIIESARMPRKSKLAPSVPNFLTILIVSAPKNSENRDLIRRSWLQACNRNDSFIITS